MGPLLVLPPQLVFLNTFFFFFILWFARYFASADEQFSACEPFNCGEITNLSYPFWSDSRPNYCGHPKFKLNCEGDNITMNMASQNFRVIDVQSSTRTLKIVRKDLWGTKCPKEFNNITLDYAFFNYTSNDVNSTILYDCDPYPLESTPNPVNLSDAMMFECPINGNPRQAYLSLMGERRFNKTTLGCGISITVPVLGEAARRFVDEAINPGDVIGQGFEVEWELKEEGTCEDCRNSGGRCGYNGSFGGFACFCPNQSYDQHGFCFSDYKAQNSTKSLTPLFFLCVVAGAGGLFALRNKVIVGVVSAVVVSGVIGLLYLCTNHCRYKIKSWRRRIGLCKTSKVDQNIEAFIRNHGSLALTRYKYGDVKKMTNSFKHKLGQGGYGSVYKGKLLNGHPVAVKLLKASGENGEDFINEVASISRTSHVNIVTLVGFCFEGKQKALIYEFMPNGSLDKFIYNKEDINSFCLTWEKLRQIAIGIARGLEYLHRGCNTRILHFDIKPHNILLDESFCPKISDFGLAKLCLKKESIISISEVRGTIGYLAPEVWNKNIGGVSHKSDVYSYGMMLLDMVGGRKNMTVEANCSTDKYFPDYIYDQLEQDNNLGCNGVNNTGENDITKRMTIVGLWCIQTFPSQRPTMSRVIEMLEQRLDLLEMPTKPVMPSPPRLELESSTTANTTT